MILIYSKAIDDFVNQVIDYLEEDFIRIGDIEEVKISNIEIFSTISSFKISNAFFKNTNIDNIKAIWFNGGYVCNKETEYENDCYQMLVETFISNKKINKIGRLFGKFEINKLDTIIQAKKEGFKIPDTLFTEEKEKLISFYNKYEAKFGIICKRITDSYYYKYDDYTHNFNLTFSIDNQILKDIPENFAISMFQERILADFEIRVIYVKGNIYAMSIHSFDDKIDYKSDIFTDRIRTITFKLPIDIEKKMINVFKKFNLNYGSADLMFYNNEYYFLEINPTGQISFVNEACNFKIEKKVAKLLINEK